MRKIRFTNLDNTVIRAELELPGLFLNPPSVLVFRGRVYHYRGSGMDSNHYREIPDTYLVVGE